MSPPSRLFSLHYGVTVRKEYLTWIETSRVKTFKENRLEFRTFAETSSSETRIVFVRIAINEEIEFKQTLNNSQNTVNIACEASVSVLFRSKGHVKNGASKRGGGGEERKETLADKPRDFENHPHRLSCLSGRSDIWSCQQLS